MGYRGDFSTICLSNVILVYVIFQNWSYRFDIMIQKSHYYTYNIFYLCPTISFIFMIVQKCGVTSRVTSQQKSHYV